jgi:hypothetical protein
MDKKVHLGKMDFLSIFIKLAFSHQH